MIRLPSELIISIVSHLHPRDIISLSKVNSKLRDNCLHYLTKNNKNKKLNEIFKKMRISNFYDYNILLEKDMVCLDFFIELYDLKLKYISLEKKINSLCWD